MSAACDVSRNGSPGRCCAAEMARPNDLPPRGWRPWLRTAPAGVAPLRGLDEDPVLLPVGSRSADSDATAVAVSSRARCGRPPVGPLLPAVVLNVADQSAMVYAKDLGFQQIDWDGLAWARKQLDNERTGPAPKTAAEVLGRGDVIYIYTDGKHTAQLVQLPEAQAALVSVDPTDGAVSALVGGFDYFSNKFNRAVQAKRQPGSSFKPFLYSSALENGFTAASVLPDAPIVIEGSGMETAWRPKNSHGTFNGPTRLREALAQSLNLVSIRLLREIGVDYAINYVTRFGFDKDSLPNNFTLALGTMEVAPIDLAGAYATFANGGFRVSPTTLTASRICPARCCGPPIPPSPAGNASRARI